jgi:hypothetical protein
LSLTIGPLTQLFVIRCEPSLFLHEYHEDLLHTLGQLLREGGEALIVAPRRARTLQDFVEKAKEQRVGVRHGCKRRRGPARLI